MSEKAIATFISKAEKKGRLDSDLRQESKEELVRKLNLVSNAYLANAAVLLFHNDPEKYIFGSFIKIGFFESDSEILYQDCPCILSGRLHRKLGPWCGKNIPLLSKQWHG